MTKFKYIVGNERSEVIEHKDFSSSIFANQYAQALKTIDRYINSEIKTPHSWNKHVDETLRVIAFCGERGDGKSSCMRSVMWMIDNLKDYNSFDLDDREFIDNLNLKSLGSAKEFHMLPVIDPAFFDNKHNVLELIVGQIFSEVLAYKDDDVNRLMRKNLMGDFQNIKSAIEEMSSQKPNGYDEITELSSLAFSMTLRKHIENMMEHYLNFIDKKKLIIAIDDIDLNMGKAYEMCEQLRKYLGNKQCVILISVKLPQLHSAISAHIKIENQNLKDPEIFLMASKYIDKLLPSATRIAMPNVYGFSEIPMSIYEKESAAAVYDNNRLKDGIVELIFQRTRYLFYNSLGGVSQIVPSNLRELTMLLGLITSMNTIAPDHSSELETAKLNSNKLLFKEYFYTEWIQRLSVGNQNEIEKWLKPENKFAQNKLIAQYLNKFKNLEVKNYSVWEDDENVGNKSIDHFKKITAKENFSYNVSLGDVFHLIHLLEQDHLDSEQERMLFFIKSHYSILLYEAYDYITKDIENLFPKSIAEDSILFRFDERFTQVNDLQRIVGSYFCYEPNELLPTSANFTNSFDIRKINLDTDFNNIHDSAWDILIKEAWDGLSLLKYETDILSQEDKEDILNKVRIVEFFMLTLSRNIPSKENNFNPLTSDFRKNVRPAYVQNFYSPMKYFLFDALMPFASLINLRFAYNRFYKLYRFGNSQADNNGNDFFDLALMIKGTLLRDMIEAAWRSRHGNKIPKDFNAKLDNLENGYEAFLNNLLSDAVIRNGEVLAAIFANLKSRRYDVRDKKDVKKIVQMYRLIQESGMATHKVAKDEDPYKLTFGFLTPLMDFLNKNADNPWFESIFDQKKASIEDDFQFPELQWIEPTYEQLEEYITHIWRTSGRGGQKETLTRRTLRDYFNGRLSVTDYEFTDILNSYERHNGIPSRPHHPYTIEELTRVLYDAGVYIPLEELIKD